MREPCAGEGERLSGNQPAILYKFHEGYTNAVRRPVLMKDLL